MEAAARAAQKVSGRAGSWIARNDRGSLPPRPPWLQGVVTRLARDLPDTPRGIVDRPACGRRVEPVRAEIRDYVSDQMHNKIEHVIYDGKGDHDQDIEAQARRHGARDRK